MPWEIKVEIDADQNDVGVATATWLDPTRTVVTIIPPSTYNPTEITVTDKAKFIYSKRIKATLAQVNIFCADAVAERDAWRTRFDLNITHAGTVLTRMIAADPEV